MFLNNTTSKPTLTLKISSPITSLTNCLPNNSGSTLHLNFATINDTKFVTFLNAKSNYTTVKIGSSVSAITNNPFTGATNLSTFTSASGSFTGSGATLTSDTKLICYANPSATTASFSQATIGNGANVFTRPTTITAVTLTSTTSGSLVGASAFNGCTALATVSVARPDYWTGTMGASAFQSKAITLSLTGNYAPATNLINALPNTSGSTLHLNISGTWSANLMPFLNAKTNYSVTASASVTAISASTFTGLTLTNASWDLISLISKYNIASNLFAVGDTKTITITDYGEATFAILGFNHDDLTSGGKAGITFGMENLLGSTGYAMNGTDAASSTNVGGWEASEMRANRIPDVLSKMPSDLQSAMKTVIKKTSAGNQSTSIVNSNDKLFLFSEVEINGTTTATYADEGTQYDYYKTVKDGTTTAGRIKYQDNGSGSAYIWWLRSPYVTNATYFRRIYNSGGVGNDPSSGAYRLCLGFCI